MADKGNPVCRRRIAPEQSAYKETLTQLANFVENELGNGRAPRPRPDSREWMIQRAKTIQMLNELREKLDKVCVNANYGKTVGIGADVIGTVITIVGAVMSLWGNSSSEKVVNTGKLMQQTGTCISGLSNLIESVISDKYLREIQTAMKEDLELSRPLAQWLNFSNELDINVQDIFGVSLTSGSFETVIKVFQDIAKLSYSVRDFNSVLSLMKQEKYSVYIGNDVKVEKLEKFYRCLSASPMFSKRMLHILPALSTQGVKFCIDGAQTYCSIMSMCSSSDAPVLQGGLDPEIPTTREVSVFCCFQTISLAANVLSIINTQNIIKNGTSKYSDVLKNVTRSLAWELERIENLQF